MSGKRPAAEPLTAAEFAALLRPLKPARRIAVAVSGGPDSMALAALIRDWARGRGDNDAIRLHALIVDHGFRPESADEAQMVSQRLQALNLPTMILTRQDPAPKTARQAIGRQDRYRLMLDWCRENGFEDLLVAHHMDDQAETVVMRAMAGSGLDGLAAMRPTLTVDGARIIRPLLSVPKVRLTATCQALGLEYVNDPSNQDPVYGRTIIRAWLAGQGNLPVEDATARRMARLTGRAARAADALDHYRDLAIRDLVTWHAAGWTEIDRAGLEALPLETALRVMLHVGKAVGGAALPLVRAEAALASILAGGTRTIGRAEIRRSGKGAIGVWRQQRHLPTIHWPAGEHEIIWDGRFHLWRADATHAVWIEPVRQVTKDLMTLGIDRRALSTMPMIDGQPVPLLAPDHSEHISDGVTGRFIGSLPGTGTADTAT